MDISPTDIFLAEIDPVEYARIYMDQTIYENQAETIRAIANPIIKKVVGIHARQTGKTHSLSTACINLGERYSGVSHGNILIFAPREAQAMLDLQRMKSLTQFKPHFNEVIDWQSCTKSTFVFKDKQVGKFSKEPGIIVKAYSAAETANTEGESAGMIILEEAQKISDKVVSEVILPMGGAWGAKIVKVGTPRLRNHFWQSANDPTYLKCIFPWEKCKILNRSGSTVINGEEISTYILDRMPRQIKQEYWPENPLIECNNNLVHVWDIPGDMSPDDFRTQYKLEWLLDVDTFLSDEEVLMLYGEHDTMTEGNPSEQYFAGLDIAGGSLTDPHDGGRNDYTALTIIKKHPNGMKQVVYKDERYGTDYANQIQWIREICNARDGLFPCGALFADATGCGMPVIDVLRNIMPRTAILGVMFNRAEPESGKNWKNAMYDHFKMELTSNNFKYPNMGAVLNHQLFSKHVEEWQGLESKRTTGVNKIIKAVGEEHDDGPCADILACYVSDRLNHVRKVLKQGRTGRSASPILVGAVGASRRSNPFGGAY